MAAAPSGPTRVRVRLELEHAATAGRAESVTRERRRATTGAIIIPARRFMPVPRSPCIRVGSHLAPGREPWITAT